MQISSQARSVLQDLDLNILQYGKQTQLINSNYSMNVNLKLTPCQPAMRQPFVSRCFFRAGLFSVFISSLAIVLSNLPLKFIPCFLSYF